MEGGIPSPSVQAQRFPCFLKTVTENSFKNRMHIPKPFVECYGSELKGSINIEGPSGEVWLAEVSIVDQGLDGYRFGWKAFATDIGLKKGDQLLFTLIAKSHFNIRVFDKSGLEYSSVENRGNAVTTTDRKRKKREDSNNEILDSKSCHDVHNSGGDEKLTSEQQPTVRSFYQDTKCKGGATSGGTLEAELVGYNSTKDLPRKRLRTRMRGMISHKFPEKPNVKPPKPSSKENMQKCAPGLYSQTWESRRRPVTEAERQKTMDAALALKTEYPSVVVLMKPSHVYRGFWLNIPCDFAKSHFPKEDTDLILEDDNGYKWPARWLRNAGRRGLSGGWGTFSRDHFLEEGDVCVYEVVDSCNWRIVVHIFRVVDVKITPGSRGEGCLHYRVVKGAGYQHKSSWKNLKVNNSPMKTHSRKSPHVFSKVQKKQGRNWLKMALQKLSHKATEPKTGMSKAAPEGGDLMADDTQVDIKPTLKVQSVSPKPSHCSSAGPILAGDMDKVPNIDVKPGPEQLRPFLKQYYDAARTDTEVDVKPKVKFGSGTLKTPPPCCAVPIPIDKMGKVQLPSIDVKPSPEQLKAALRHVCDARSNGFNTHEATLASETLEPSPKPMYKVSRLISRRMKKGAAEREFMVELEGAVAHKMQSGAESKNGENHWWIPYSHFSPDFKSCYI